jgi:hypothetical protein
MMELKGASVSISSQGYAVIHYNSHVLFGKLGPGDVVVIEAILKAEALVAEAQAKAAKLIAAEDLKHAQQTERARAVLLERRAKTATAGGSE